MTSLPYPPFRFYPGHTGLLVSIPHSGLHLTPEVQTALTPKAQKLPDTDWYLPQLYDFLSDLGVGVIAANYSRYVIDLNRPFDDQALYNSKTTGLFPSILFDESPVFDTGREPGDTLKQEYKNLIWKPYHAQITQELSRLKAQFGQAILFDAHSIASKVPMLFDGQLRDFNWGSNDGHSCTAELTQAVTRLVDPQYSQVLNGRFKGGYITRAFGQPTEGTQAIQLELSQDTYLDQSTLRQGEYRLCNTKAPIVQQQLRHLIEGILKLLLIKSTT
ncbi:N-formylglutamate deformylase [Gynuella sunshinyii]|uniref:N-formylglutamate amidohydrolase n=1 Tax=Gynuella sunshinyii YC6258 TaxID=1445510 RepID=A0A0C5V731_9GAMM|nr:N-formylglutamate deformylase [Gynuella sunshinyii]AJQ95220.1 N-formylglutamate amidohydrolase [Gynuella sunshinyii YC6258]